MSIRALHYVFKIGDRKASYDFFVHLLGMKILRHEEFEKGCEATCNGPYDGKWSKTMVGYGAEDNHFVLELTYNYGIGSYILGNDFAGIWLRSSKVIENAKIQGLKLNKVDNLYCFVDPDGHKFYVEDISEPVDIDPIFCVATNVSDLPKSTDFWQNVCSLALLSKTNEYSEFSLNDRQLNFKLINDHQISRGTGFGRIAFSCPHRQLSDIEENAKKGGSTILNPLVKLDTPGKASVEVVILADPDFHEICFVGDEAFRELSQIDTAADKLLTGAITNDASEEWFAKSGGKPSA